MNKLAKRVLAFMLVVCLLTALVPAVVSAEAASGAVVYDFELDQNPNLIWEPNTTTDYGFGQTRLPHGSQYHQAALNNYYADGIINWTFPHTVGEDGKVVSALGLKSNIQNPIQFGGTLYNGTAVADWTGLKLSLYSKAASVDGDTEFWNALVLRAPDVGTYDVTVEYTNYAGASANTKLFLLPYTAAMKAQVASNIEAFNASINAIVAADEESEHYLNKFSSWLAAGSTSEPGQIEEAGQVSVGIDVDEYLLVVSAPAGKATVLQNVTFTPVAEQKIPTEVIERNYSIKGTVTSNVDLNRTGTTEAVETLYDAGTIDWSYLGTTALSTDTCQLQKNYIYTKSMCVNKTGTADDINAYEAFKLRSPGEGTYDISFTTYVPAANKTQIWSDVYVAEYTEGMDPETVVDAANYIGAFTPKSSANATAGAYNTTAVGEFTFGTADKEYIIVLKVNPEVHGYPTTAVDSENDRHFTAHNYMSAFVIEPQEEPLTYVPKAYIGTTPYATVAAAAAAAQSGETVKLAVDYTGNIDLPAGVSLDLAGHTWTVTNATTTNAMEHITDSVGTGKLVAKNVDLYGNNNGKLPLATAANTYSLASYSLSVTADDYEVVGEATRFWFKLSLDDAAAYDLIASGNSGLTIGVVLDWGGAEDLAVTFDNGDGAEAFAAAWATAAKNNSNIWLYVDVTGVENLTSDLTVTPVLQVSDSDLNNGSLVYSA